MNTINIDEVTDGQVVVIDAILTNLNLVKAKNNSLFISGTASNSNMSIPIKIWNTDEATLNILKDIKFISLLGTVSVYLGAKSLIVSKYKKIKDYQLSDFIPTYKITEDKKQFVSDVIDSIETENYKKLLSELITKEYYKLSCSIFKYNKHNGNFEYIYDLLNTAYALLNNSSELYSNINKEAVLTALLLCNIGSLEAQKYDEYLIAEDLTKTGKLLTIPILSLMKIIETCNKLDIDIKSEDIISLISLIVSNNNGKPANLKDVQFFRQIVYLVESFCKMETSISDVN